MRRFASLVVVLLAACGGDDAVDEPIDRPVGACDGVLHQIPGEPGVHMPAGTAIEWSSNPPATGAHYPVWAGWERSYTSLPRGNYIHNAEHGGIILLYNCPDGCPEVVRDLEQVVRDAPVDDACTAPVTKRMIVAPDPLLPEGTQVAAVAWNTYYTASCFDPYVTQFARANYRHAPEDICADGSPFNGVRIEPVAP